MKLKYRVSTVAEATQLSGPGTQVHIRPGTSQVGRDSGQDLAHVIHESTADDVHYSTLALDRERRQKLGRG